LTNIELSCNLIQYNEDALGLFASLEKLACLYLKGNALVKDCKNYRKSFVGGVRGLQYLDDRPVSKNERRTAEAWVRGGKEAEELEKKKLMEERDCENQKSFDEIVKRKEENRRKRLVVHEVLIRSALQEKERILAAIAGFAGLE